MIEFLKMYPDVILPRRATENSVGLDLHAYLKTETGRPNNMLVSPRNTRAIPTGLIAKPPEGHALFLCSRSGMAREMSLFVTNSPGVIDPDYRGELMVLLYNGGFESYYVRDGDRVGQLLCLPCPIIPFVEVQSLDFNTSRGDAGWGSSGR